MTKAELEARRDEMCANYLDNFLTVNCQVCHGFDHAVALLMPEIEAGQKDYEDMRKFQFKFMEADHKLRDVTEQLQSANAKLAVMKAAIAFYADDESGTDDCSIAREALAKIGELEK